MKWSMLTQCGAIWYSRVNVPLVVQPILRRKEIRKSLRTSDVGEAQVLALKVAAEALKLFQSLRKRRTTAKDPMSLAKAYTTKALALGGEGDVDDIRLGCISVDEARDIVDGKAKLTDFLHR